MFAKKLISHFIPYKMPEIAGDPFTFNKSQWINILVHLLITIISYATQTCIMGVEYYYHTLLPYSFFILHPCSSNCPVIINIHYASLEPTDGYSLFIKKKKKKKKKDLTQV